MWYVYTLSIDGIILYVGMSKNPAQRYRDHYTDGLSKCFWIMRYLALNKRILNMNIIHGYLTKATVLHMERQYINAYSKLLYLLNNETYQKPVISQIPRIQKLHNKTMLLAEVERIKQQELIINKISLNGQE